MKNRVEKRSMLKQHNGVHADFRLIRFYTMNFSPQTVAALVEVLKINALRKLVKCHQKNWWLENNKSLNLTRANKAARAG